MSLRESQFSVWCKSTFGGKGNAANARSYAENLLASNGFDKSAPIHLGSIAKILGFEDPRPIYKAISGDGALEIVDSAMRIVISSNSRKAPPRNHPLFTRMKFTYAHELGHSLMWNLSEKPPIRIAPNDDKRREEEVCNGLACGFLMPTSLLKGIIEHSKVGLLQYQLYFAAAEQLQVSLQAFLFGAEPVIANLLSENEFAIVSMNSINRKQKGERKIRCIQCFVPEVAKRNKRAFFSAFQGIDNASKYPDISREWSLIDFHKRLLHDAGSFFVAGECIRLPDKRIVELSGMRHERMGTSEYVWTTGKFNVTSE
ncbi:ImmA/IrrE family metallo-endopeptidase [Candidatus Sumerlaeota bacterium]|nr:ImmA/IrrE family metallo-endopeptidase [Candidatus Sumerlaeota bacterium]